MLAPVLALILLSLVVWFLTLATRIPAVMKSGLAPAQARFPENLKGLPAPVRQIADNYNHLMEQPTIFYALVFTVVLSGQSDHLNVCLAWGYTISRFVHSLIQCTVNRLALRLPVFIASTGFLIVMAVRAVPVLFAPH